MAKRTSTTQTKGVKAKTAAQKKKDKAPAKPSDFNGNIRKKQLKEATKSLARQEAAAKARDKSGKTDLFANAALSSRRSSVASQKKTDSTQQKKDDAAKQKKVAARKKQSTAGVKAQAKRKVARTKK